MGNIIYLSSKGYKELKEELHKLKSIDRPNVINQIAEARDKGDLSENAEYDAAKEAQGLLTKKKGDTVEIQIPTGILKFEIIDISR